jgi:single-strand DNA-binding protein
VPHRRGQKKEKHRCINTIQIIGFVGKDPERRQLQGKDAAYTVFSVATQRSWKNAQGEWQKRTEWHRVVAWSKLGEIATAQLRSGDHVHVQGRLVSSTYDKYYGNGKKPTVVKQTFWQVRADAMRKLNRAESHPGSAPGAANQGPSNDADAAPF